MALGFGASKAYIVTYCHELSCHEFERMSVVSGTFSSAFFVGLLLEPFAYSLKGSVK